MRYALPFCCIFLCHSAVAAQFDDIIYSASGQLCTVAAKAGSKERCLRTDHQYDSPAWRPNGKVLVVEAGLHDGPSKLLLLSASGKTIRAAVNSSGFIRPAWKPDGSYFFALSPGLGQAVGRWNAEGTRFSTLPVRAKVPFEYVQMITLSPSGTYAALLVDDFKKMLIARVKDDAFDVEQVLPTGFSYVAEAAWLDDTRLLFVGKQSGPYAQLWELQVIRGTVELRGIEGLYLRDYLTLSPDRSAAVVCATAVDAKETEWSLWKYDFSSSTRTRLTRGIEDVTPTWRQ
jgi:hypothetical protein